MFSFFYHNICSFNYWNGVNINKIHLSNVVFTGNFEPGDQFPHLNTHKWSCLLFSNFTKFWPLIIVEICLLISSIRLCDFSKIKTSYSSIKQFESWNKECIPILWLKFEKSRLSFHARAIHSKNLSCFHLLWPEGWSVFTWNKDAIKWWHSFLYLTNCIHQFVENIVLGWLKTSLWKDFSLCLTQLKQSSCTTQHWHTSWSKSISFLLPQVQERYNQFRNLSDCVRF